MSLMEQFADPNTMQSLSFGDKMAGAGITTLMGLGTTFVILLVLWFLIAMMTKIMEKGSANKKAKTTEAAPAAPVAAAPATAETEAPAAAEEVVPAENEELVAVIMAAIAASEGREIKSDLVVRKIKRMAGPTLPWAGAGRREVIESRER